MSIKLKLISAACENLGIGYKGDLPWKLENEYAYFERMTTATKDATKRNVMIMGRLTWESFVEVPGPERICIVLTRSELDVSQYDHVHVCKSFDEVIDALENSDKFKDKIEDVWVIGGSNVYKQGLDSNKFHRLYLTKIFKSFECDTFFPELPLYLKKVSDPDVPKGIQEEHGIQYEFNVFEKFNLRN